MINKNRPIKKKNFVETLEISQGASENKTNAKSIKSYTQNNREFDCIFFLKFDPPLPLCGAVRKLLNS